MRRILLAAAIAFVVVGGCGDDYDTPAPTGELDGTLTVLAAASLTDAFVEVAEAFEAAHDDVEVKLSFDGSSRLAASIIEGAPADVFASADDVNLQKVVDATRADGRSTVFATNVLQIVVAEGNPLGIEGLADLESTDVVLSLCQKDVPCGKYAAQAFERAGLAVPSAGEEDSVKGVLTKVMLGEADAGLVYVTDVLAATGVAGVHLASEDRVAAAYPAVVLNDAPNPDGAMAFVAFLTGAEAQAILADFGFGSP